MCSKFPKLSEAKVKEKVSTGTYENCIRYPLFRNNWVQRKSMELFSGCTAQAFGEYDPLYKTIIQRMLTEYKAA